LFCSNPRGPDSEGFSGERYGAFHTLETWRSYLSCAGFEEVAHYCRPAGKPVSQQPWLATVSTWFRCPPANGARKPNGEVHSGGINLAPQ
jgi:hypothetical protein